MAIDEYVARDLLAWHAVTPYKKPSDYVWATDADRAEAKRGKQPVWLSSVMRNYIQPVARKLGITKKMSWHTLRHPFSSILKANGDDQCCPITSRTDSTGYLVRRLKMVRGCSKSPLRLGFFRKS